MQDIKDIMQVMKPIIQNRAAIASGILMLAIGAPMAVGAEQENPNVKIETPAIGQKLCVNNLFQSNMVIQRDKSIRVWGWAAPGEKVTVTFAGKSGTAEAGADRSWQVELPAMPVNAEPQLMSIQGKDSKIDIENVLLGDVWVLAGQSNMEFPLDRLDYSDLEILSANYKNMRHLKVPQLDGSEMRKSFPRQMQNDHFFGQSRQGYWDAVTPATSRSIAGLGYIFARRIHMVTDVPIGTIDISRGGTCLETWTPVEVMKSIDSPEVKAKLAEWDKKVSEYDAKKDLEARKKQHHEWVANMKKAGNPIPADSKEPSDLQPGPAMDMNRPGNCYASMLAPIAGFSVKGAIWHQGYNNAFEVNGHKLYAKVFPEMIKAWREAFKDSTMPFGIITQETDGDPQRLESDRFLMAMGDEGVYIREAHYKTFLDLRKAGDKNIGYASCFDLHRSWYHPQLKIPAGERIARWALATQYGKDCRWLPPQLVEVKAEGDKLSLKMDGPVIAYADGPIVGFVVAGKDGRFQAAKADFRDKNTTGKGGPDWDRTIVVLSSPLVPEPLYFRYAWARNPLENLKAEGLPFDTQRNDSWSIIDMYEMYTGKKPATPGVLTDQEKHQLRVNLIEDDKKRHIEEARAVLKKHNVKLEK
ncbi:MAG: hypothetical protein ACKOHM_06295 [Spartobacteria bacterium]